MMKIYSGNVNSPLFGYEACSEAINCAEKEARVVSAYHTPIGSRQIFVLLSSHDTLSAKIIENGKIVAENLAVFGVPKQLVDAKNVGMLTKFLSRTHSLAEKGIDGLINRVSIHVSVDGGMRGMIPFQPGLALGSVVRGDILEKLETVAEKSAQVENYREQIRTSKQRIEELLAEKESRKIDEKMWQKVPGFSDALNQAADNEITAITKYITDLIKDLKNIQFELNIPPIANFATGAQSPINIESSPVVVQPRGFETMSYHSQYYRNGESASNFQDHATSQGSSFSGSLNVGWGPFSVGGSHSRASATASRVTNMLQQEATKGVLVVSANVSTRHVRTFKHLEYDVQRLKYIKEAIVADKESKGNEADRVANLKRLGISKIGTNEAGKKAEYFIYLLTEAVLGGSFTAIITFLDESKAKRNRNVGSSDSSHSTSASASVGIGPVTVGGGGSYSASKASEQEDDRARQIQNTQVSIEVITQGVIPQFARENIEREIMAGLDTNPAKFEISQRDKNLISTLVSGSGKEKEIAMLEQQTKMQNAQVATLNTLRALTEKKDVQQVHGTGTIFKAYDDFAGKMASDEGCGIPIGFFVTYLGEAEMDKLIRASEGAAVSSGGQLGTDKPAGGASPISPDQGGSSPSQPNKPAAGGSSNS